MKIRAIAVLSLAGIAMSSPLLAGPVGVQRTVSQDQAAADVAQLEAKKDETSRFMIAPPYNKGPILIQNMDRVSRLNDLINRLQAGQPVSPDEIDQQLQAPLH